MVCRSGGNGSVMGKPVQKRLTVHVAYIALPNYRNHHMSTCIEQYGKWSVQPYTAP